MGSAAISEKHWARERFNFRNDRITRISTFVNFLTSFNEKVRRKKRVLSPLLLINGGVLEESGGELELALKLKLPPVREEEGGGGEELEVKISPPSIELVTGMAASGKRYLAELDEEKSLLLASTGFTEVFELTLRLSR